MKKFFVVFISLILLLSLTVPVFVSADSGDESLTIAEWFRRIFDTLVSTLKYISNLGEGGFVNDLWQSFKLGFNNIINKLQSVQTGLGNLINNLNSTFSSWLSTANSWLQNIHSTISTRFQNFTEWLQNIHSTLSTRLLSVVDWLKDIHSTLSVRVSSVIDNLVSLGSKFTTGFNSIVDKIEGVFVRPDDVESVPTVPDVDGFDSEFNDITDNAENAQSFVGDTFDSLSDYLLGFHFVKNLFDSIAGISFFSFLLNNALSLGLLALSLNLLGTIVSRSSSSARSKS